MTLSSYAVIATDLFEIDLDEAVSYYLQMAGPRSAASLLDDYDTMRELLKTLPGYGSNVYGTPYRWRPLKSFIAVYAIDDEARTVTLMRLFYLTSNWRERLLKEQGLE